MIFSVVYILNNRWLNAVWLSGSFYHFDKKVQLTCEVLSVSIDLEVTQVYDILQDSDISHCSTRSVGRKSAGGMMIWCQETVNLL